MTALMTLVAALAVVALLMFLSERFRRLPPPLRIAILIFAAGITGILLTMELFIYVHERWVEFRQAIGPLPLWIPLVIAAAVAMGAYRVYRLLANLDTQTVGSFVSRNLTPHLKAMWREIRGREGLLSLFRRKKSRRYPREGQSSSEVSRRG